MVGKQATWKPHKAPQGKLESATTVQLPDSVFAFLEQRKEPMTDVSHVRNAIARFDQVKDVTDAERDQAFANIKKAAQHFGVDLKENDWRELGNHPHTKNRSQEK